MVVEPGEGRRLSPWVKSLVVLLVVFIGVPSGVFVYRKWVDWRVNVEVEKTIESDEVHDLVHDYLQELDPNAFTERGAIRGFAVKKGSGYVVPMGGINFDVTAYGQAWKVRLGIDLTKGPGGNIAISGGCSGDETDLYPYLEARYGKGYIKAISKRDKVEIMRLSKGR